MTALLVTQKGLLLPLLWRKGHSGVKRRKACDFPCRSAASTRRAEGSGDRDAPASALRQKLHSVAVKTQANLCAAPSEPSSAQDP